MGKAIETWEVDLGTLSPRTRTSYLRQLEKFCKRFEVTPEELYEMRDADLSSTDRRDHKRIEGMVKTYMAELGRDHIGVHGEPVKAKSPRTCATLMYAMKSFFESQEMELRFKSRDTPKGGTNGQRIILPEQIKDVYDAAARALQYKKRNRAMLLFQKDSGIRIGDTASLNIKDYTDATLSFNDARERFKYFDPIITNKKKIVAHIHIGPESIEAIDAYLEERQVNGEILSPDAPLFKKGQWKGRPRTQPLNPALKTRLTSIAITAIFTRLAAHLGVKGKKISAHSFRKFHQTMCESTMPKNYVAKLQGKKINDSTGPYSHPEDMPGELMKFYIAGYDRLRVLTVETSDMVDLRAQLESANREKEAMRREIQTLRNGTQSRDTRIDSQDNKIDQLTKQMDEILKKLSQ